MTWTIALSVLLGAIALAAAITGINLFIGRWSIPADRQGKVTLVAVITTFLLGILSVLMCLNPAWAKKLSQPIRKLREA